MAASSEIRGAIRDARRIIDEAQRMDGNEAETRRRVERIFESVMGYDVFKNLSREHAVHGVGDTEHMDFAVKVTPEKISIVVELKRVNIDLAPKHLKQAMRYAVDLGCEWVLLTNGRHWELHHIQFGQPPDARLIKSWNLMQDEVSDLEENFGLISLRSLKKDSLAKIWQTQSALTADCLLDEILSEESLRRVKNAIRRKTGVSVHPEDIVAAVRKLLNEHAGSLMDEMKISLPERKARASRKESSETPEASEPVSEPSESQTEQTTEASVSPPA